MQDINNPLFFEKLLIKFLFMREDIRDVTLPYLKPEIFIDSNVKNIVKEIVDFHNIFGKFPKPGDLFLNIKSETSRNVLKEIGQIDSRRFLEENLVHNVELFIQKQLVMNVLGEATENLINGHVDKIDPQKLLEAKTFSFNTSIGLDVFEDDGEQFFNHLHDEAAFIPTGLLKFDKMLCGGFKRKALTMFVAGTNVGKTRIKCALTKNIIYQNNNVLFIPLEGTKEVIKERLLYNFLDMSRNDLKKLSLTDMKELFKKCLILLNSKIIIEEYPEHTLNANKLRLLLKNLKEKKKFIPDLIFLDYMGLVVPNMTTKDGGNQASNLKRASEEFHAVAKEFNIALVSSMQFNREGFESSDPAMSDISESFATLFTADEVILLIQTDDMLKENRQLWKKVKTRTGNKGMSGNLYINDEKQNMYELEAGQITDQEKQKNNKIIQEETDIIKKGILKTEESIFAKNFDFE
jgi:Kyanoviridae DNA primase/helicase